MERNEVLQIMAVLRTAYPNSYRSTTRQEAESEVDLWQAMFSDDDPALVGAAVKAIIVSDTREFSPNIGIVKEKMRELTQPKELTEAEAWGIVAKAVRNGVWGSKEEFEKLPAECKRIVGSPNQLREWAMMDSGALHSVVASNFQRSYKIIAQRKKEEAKLPTDIRKMLGSHSERLMLNE